MELSAGNAKFSIFSELFMCGRILSISGMGIMDFPKISKISNDRSDFKMDHIIEFLSEFAHFGVWWASKVGFSKSAKKTRFAIFWTSDKLQKPLSPMGISAAFLRSRAYSVPKSPEICFFSLRRKIKGFIPIILQNGLNPTETRSSGLKWNLSAPRKNSTFSHISSNFSWKCAGKCEFPCFLLSEHWKRS